MKVSGTFNLPLAPLSRRMGAFAVDTALSIFIQVLGAYLGAFFSVLVVVTNSSSHGSSADLEAIGRSGGVFGWFYWGMTYWIINYAILQGITGATVGKWFFGLEVTKTNGAPITSWDSLNRSIAYLVSAFPYVFPFYAGFWAAFFSKNHQAWHDKIAGTVVVERKRAVLNVISLPAPTASADESSSQAA